MQDFNAISIRSQTETNLIKRTNRAIKSPLLFTSLLAQFALLMQRVPRCMNVSWPPCCLLHSAQVLPFSPSPRNLKIHCQLHSLTLCYNHHHQPLKEKQLFCLDDSIFPFGGISIIILITAFDPNNTETDVYPSVCHEFLSFKKKKKKPYSFISNTKKSKQYIFLTHSF